MFDKIRQLKELRDQAERMKELLGNESASGESRGVRIVMNGNQEVLTTEISSDLLSPEKKSDLERAVTDATNEAVKNIHKVIAQKMQESGEFRLPGLL